MSEDQNTPEQNRERGNKWLERIAAAEKREEKWIKSAERAEAIYSADTDSEVQSKVYDFNILHSNVETIVPAIYNSTPQPDIRDKFRSGDDLAKSVADVLERVIICQIDDNRLDKEIEAGAQDAFLAGRDVVRLRFEADEEDGQVYNESISFEAVSWRDYREGPARRFDDLPWMAFRHFIPEEDLEDFEDGELAAPQRQLEKTVTDESKNEDLEIWEIWDKRSLRVLFVSAADGVILKEEDDPLGLKNFFPIPEPVQPIGLTGRRTPVCPFVIYEELANELDTTTRRINAILAGLKVKGWIVGNSEDVSQLAVAGDNELVPISGFESAAATGGIERAIVWWPIDKAIQVLRELYTARDQTKQAIYEITGISDIVRGASEAGETATAQNIKTQWGSLRIKKMQRLIERQVRNIFSLVTELAASKFSTETLERITGLQITPEMESILRSPLDSYRIDVESDSTVRADLTRVKGELSEFLNGTANYFATMAPVIEQAPEAAGPVADIYASFGRLFNLGQQGEAAIESMVEIAKKAGSQPRPNPEAEAAKANMEMEKSRAQMDAQFKEADFKMRMQESRAKQKIDEDRMKLDISKSEIDREIKAIELKIKERELGIKERQQEIDTAAKAFEIEIEKEQQRAAKVG